MARRAKPTSEKQMLAPETVEPVPTDAPRRGRKSKPAPSEAAEPLLTDAISPDEMPPDDVAEAEATPPAKARRGGRSQTKAQPGPEASAPEDVAEAIPSSDDADHLDAQAESSTTPSAARWDAKTGTATFDWPSIERVAATDGPNQAMAKLLLAARAEGANSRWPF